MTDDPTIATYNRVAAAFATRNFDTIHPDFAAIRARFAEAIVGKAPAERFRILDAGCGPGRDSKWFQERGFQVVGVDLSSGMLEEARRRVPNVEFRQVDLRQLDFCEASFDGIWCSASLLHLPRADVPVVLTNFRRFLGHGYLFVCVKSGQGEEVEKRGYGPGNPRRFTYFSRHEMELYVERAGFVVRDVTERQPTPSNSHPWLQIIAQTNLRTPLVGAIAVVLDAEGHVLLSERADGRGWNLPAGFVDATEAPDEAVIREVREETGLEVQIDRLVGIYARPRPYEGVASGLLTHAFLCRPVGGTLAMTKEALQHGWFDPDTLPQPMSSRHHVEILRDALTMRADPKSFPVMRRFR